MSDLIRRDDVYEALGITDKSTKYGGDHSGYDTLMLYEIMGAIDCIPTAEPLVTVTAKQNEGLYLDTDEETLLETEYIVVATNGWYKEYIHETDGKPRVGKWIDDEEYNTKYGYYFAHCSECGYQMDVHENRGYHNYCPNCGAKMERSE